MASSQTGVHLLISTTEMDRSRAFYTELLDAQEVERGSRRSVLTLPEGAVDLVQAEAFAALDLDPARPCLMVEVQNIDAALEAVAKGGGKVVRAPEHTPLGRAAKVSDPDGRDLLVVTPHTSVPGE